jgi:hypothetical protein
MTAPLRAVSATENYIKIIARNDETVIARAAMPDLNTWLPDSSRDIIPFLCFKTVFTSHGCSVKYKS